MAILPPDPVFCLKSEMGPIHNLCFLSNESNATDLLAAATEEGFVYIWDLKVCNYLVKLQQLIIYYFLLTD